jgi:putative tributyrin esterase
MRTDGLVNYSVEKLQMKNCRSVLFFLIAGFVLTAHLFAQAPQKLHPFPQSTTAIFDVRDIRTLKLNSKLTGREMSYRVILPTSYNNSNETIFYPVIYLLHGLGGHFDNWTEKTNLGQYSLGFQCIIVTPEGNDGWYTDSVSVPNDKYESYIVEELIPEIEKKFHAKSDRAHRVIAGLSMGGYGALKFGLKYSDKFILAGSFSGALGITDLPAASKQFVSVKNVFGEDGSQTRKANDIFKILREMPAEKMGGLPFLYVACGTEDFLFSNNQDFMKLMTEKKAKHEYRELPGTHSWPFWDGQIQEFLRLADKIFNNK